MTDAKPPSPEAAPKTGGGIFLPTPVVVTLLLALAGVVATYVFVTKTELMAHASANERTHGEDAARLTALELTAGQTKETITELKDMLRMTDANVRTLLIQAGVPNDRIAQPKK